MYVGCGGRQRVKSAFGLCGGWLVEVVVFFKLHYWGGLRIGSTPTEVLVIIVLVPCDAWCFLIQLAMNCDFIKL